MEIYWSIPNFYATCFRIQQMLTTRTFVNTSALTTVPFPSLQWAPRLLLRQETDLTSSKFMDKRITEPHISIHLMENRESLHNCTSWTALHKLLTKGLSCLRMKVVYLH